MTLADQVTQAHAAAPSLDGGEAPANAETGPLAPLRTGWKAHARKAIKKADPWAAWHEIRHAPPDEVVFANLDKGFQRLLAAQIKKHTALDRVRDLFQLATEAARDEKMSLTVVNAIAFALTRLASDETLPGEDVLSTIEPLVSYPVLDPVLIDLILDTFEVVIVRTDPAQCQLFLSGMLAEMRLRNYERVQLRSLQRAIALGEALA